MNGKYSEEARRGHQLARESNPISFIEWKKQKDLEIREDLWNHKNIVLACDKHMERFKGKSYVKQMKKIKLYVTCGIKDCINLAEYEIELEKGECHENI